MFVFSLRTNRLGEANVTLPLRVRFIIFDRRVELQHFPVGGDVLDAPFDDPWFALHLNLPPTLGEVAA